MSAARRKSRSCPRMVVRPLAGPFSVLPVDTVDADVLLLRVDATRRVVEKQIFHNYPEATRTSVHGFTHWARLPRYLL